MSENVKTSYGSHLKNLTNILTSTKSMTEVLQSFRCISESYNNIEIEEHKYSSIRFDECTKEEQEFFINDQLTLIECLVTNSIYDKSGITWNWKQIYDLLHDEEYSKCEKIKRKVVYPTSSHSRPIGDIAFQMWNGTQIIDLDIKDEKLANKIKYILFENLNKFHWFLGVTKSASGKGLHVWTKITPLSIKPENKRVEYLCNFRHKYSYIYIVLLNYVANNTYCKADIIDFMDMAMAKPQQGIFISSDKEAIMSTNFQDLRLDVNFETAFDNGISSIDWLSHQDLKDIFSKLEWFNNENFDTNSNVDISAIANIEDRDLSKAQGRKHYKHNQRWQLANTLTSLYGKDKAYEIMCQICSETAKRELKGDVNTASLHNKPISIWAVKELNSKHGFNIQIKVENENFQETVNKIVDNVKKDNRIDYVQELTDKSDKEVLNINHNQYLGDIKDEIISKLKKITLLEAGAGYGKTEMIKALKSKTLLILPFTSTIKAKVESDEKVGDWLYYYGAKRPTLQDLMGSNSISMTIDKFAHLNLYELNAADFKYIVIDESHLLFTSSFRDVMSPAIQRLANCSAKVIMMTGTPTGEKLFFPNIKHIKVIKEDLREKKFQVFFTPTKMEQLIDMCTSIADDILAGRKVLFPTNKGNIYFDQVIGLIEKILEQKTEGEWNRSLNYFYYKKSNTGEKSMDDINIEKSIGNNDIIFCTSFLSVGVDICDRYEFRVYFSELWISQDIEQFANRIRNNNLFIKIYLPKRDTNGYPINYDIVNPLDLSFDKEDLILIRDFIRTCNDLLDRNNEEYKYNPLIQNIISANRYLKYDENDCKYYIDETAYKLKVFEDRYITYGKQLQILMKGMTNFGYTIEIINSNNEISEEKYNEIEEHLKQTRRYWIDDFTKNTLLFLDHITEDNIDLYKELTKGNYELFKSDKYEELRGDNNLYVESIEVLEKNIPFVIKLYKYFDVETIKEIFKYCIETKYHVINYTGLARIYKFCRIEDQRKKKKLDFPVLRFIQDTKNWVKENPKRTMDDINEYINLYTCKYANTVKNVVLSDVAYLETLKKYITELFFTIIFKGRSKTKVYNLRIFELLWNKKDNIDLLNVYGDANTQMFFAAQLLDTIKEEEIEDEAPDFVTTEKLTYEDIEPELNDIVHSQYGYYEYSELDGSNNRFMRKQENTQKQLLNVLSEEVKNDISKEDNLFSDLEDLPF